LYIVVIESEGEFQMMFFIENQANYYLILVMLSALAVIGYGLVLRSSILKLDAGTEKMDCSEFVSRYLQKLGLFDNVPLITTAALRSPDDFSETNEGQKLQYIVGSNRDDFVPKPGDVFAWSRSIKDGHTGVVVEYNEVNDYVVVMEAIGCKEPCSNDLILNPNRGCCQVVKSTYKRTGKSLQSHTGWIGYFRPVIE
jgi:hypothetical protein